MNADQSVDEYLAKISAAELAEFERIKKIVLGLAPSSTLTISYGMPTFKLNGKVLLHFGVFKNHMSLFAGGQVSEELASKLGDHKTSKGTIQFTQENTLSDEIIIELVETKLQQL